MRKLTHKEIKMFVHNHYLVNGRNQTWLQSSTLDYFEEKALNDLVEKGISRHLDTWKAELSSYVSGYQINSNRKSKIHLRCVWTLRGNFPSRNQGLCQLHRLMNLALAMPGSIQAERLVFIFRFRKNLIGLQNVSQIQSLSTEHNWTQSRLYIMLSQCVFHQTMILPEAKRLGGEESVLWSNKFCKCLIKELRFLYWGLLRTSTMLICIENL